MNNDDRLERIKQLHNGPINSYVDGSDIDWLISEVERLQFNCNEHEKVVGMYASAVKEDDATKERLLQKVERLEKALKDIRDHASPYNYDDARGIAEYALEVEGKE
jgi:hypothetical protein